MLAVQNYKDKCKLFSPTMHPQQFVEVVEKLYFLFFKTKDDNSPGTINIKNTNPSCLRIEHYYKNYGLWG